MYLPLMIAMVTTAQFSQKVDSVVLLLTDSIVVTSGVSGKFTKSFYTRLETSNLKFVS
jgi:hypothetical protein